MGFSNGLLSLSLSERSRLYITENYHKDCHPRSLHSFDNIIVKYYLAFFSHALSRILYCFDNQPDFQIQIRIILGPMILALLFTLVFYIRSIFLLKKQRECHASSTHLYIRSLRCYAYGQFLLYLPVIVSLIWMNFGSLLNDNYWGDFLSGSLGGFITLSGFINALNFTIQGPIDDHTRDIDDNLSEGMI